MTTVANRYELLEQLGSGGMATVWRAWDQRLQRYVAVKLLAPVLAADPGFQVRFEREARHAARLSHPNVVAVFDFGADDGIPFLVMELVDGESLGARLRRAGVLDPISTVQVCGSILDGLAEAHGHGIIHRDVKPSNILIGTNGNVKIADFGVARTLGDSAHLTDTGVLMGTVGYLSPEQCAGKPASPRSDLYAVGCVVYECLTGGPPFTGESPASVMYQHLHATPISIGARRPETPAQLRGAVERALQKDPDFRFTSASQMKGALTQGLGVSSEVTDVGHPFIPLDHLPTQEIDKTTPFAHRQPIPERKRWRLYLVATAALLLVIGASAVGAVELRHRAPGSSHRALPPSTVSRTTTSTSVPPTTTSPSTTTTTASTTTTEPSPVQAGFDYQAAVQKVANLGYSVSGDQSDVADQLGPLYVVTATCTESGDGYCQNAFFFVDNRYIGTDTSSPDVGVSVDWDTGSTVALDYPLYAPGDPNCCPTGGDRTVRFYWDGSSLTPLDPLPNNPNETS